MIDYEKSAELNECTVEELKARFERFPSSRARIIAKCMGCDLEREIYFYAYREMCSICVRNTPEYREASSKRTMKRFKDNPNAGAEHSRTMIKYFKLHPEIGRNHAEKRKQYYKTHPEAREWTSKERTMYYISHPEARVAASVKTTKQFAKQSTRNEHSSILKNSVAARDAADKMIGGDDIVRHHYVYDHSDLSKYTVRMSRTEHSRLHRLFESAGIIIQHINIPTIRCDHNV